MYLLIRRITTLAILVVNLQLAVQSVGAQDTGSEGKLFGTISDLTTKTPLFGASAQVVGTQRGTEISVSLELEAVEMEGITVTAKESYFEKDPEAEVSGRTMDSTEIMDSAGSAMDVQRVVQVLPSVVSAPFFFRLIRVFSI